MEKTPRYTKGGTQDPRDPELPLPEPKKRPDDRTSRE